MCSNLLLSIDLFSKFLAEFRILFRISGLPDILPEFRKKFVNSVPVLIPGRNFDSGSTLWRHIFCTRIRKCFKVNLHFVIIFRDYIMFSGFDTSWWSEVSEHRVSIMLLSFLIMCQEFCLNFLSTNYLEITNKMQISNVLAFKVLNSLIVIDKGELRQNLNKHRYLWYSAPTYLFTRLTPDRSSLRNATQCLHFWTAN